MSRRNNCSLLPRLIASATPIIGLAAMASAQCQPTFTAPTVQPAGNDPQSLAVGDFNGDGKADVVSQNGVNELRVYLGNGDGTLNSPTVVAAGASNSNRSVVVGDFNGDGKDDLAVADHNLSRVYVLLGNGDGTFAPQVFYAVGSTPQGLVAGDFNRDGKSDLASINEAGTVSVLLSNTGGTFAAAATYPSGSQSYAAAVGDFNRDGRLDLAVVNVLGNSVSLLYGNTNGTFQAIQSFPAGALPNAIVAADINRDGRLDLLVRNAGGGVTVLLATSVGGFGIAGSVATQADWPFAVADVSGDGKADLLAGTSVMLGNGDGTFGSPYSIPAGGFFAFGDLDRDGETDVIALNGGGLWSFLQRGIAPTSLTLQPSSSTVVPGGTAMFSVGSGTSGVAFRWRRNGVPLVDAPTGTGSVFTGTGSATLTLSNAGTADNGSAYDCVVTTACGTQISQPAGLAVALPPHCAADMGMQGGIPGIDGALDNNDFIVFINQFFSHTGCP